MGMYGEVEIIATYETEAQAETVIESLEENTKELIAKEYESFHFELTECDLDGECIIIKIASDRFQNAEWQGQQLLNYMKTTEGLYEFTADVMTPQNYIWWNKDEE